MASPALTALLNSASPLAPVIERDFYTITLFDGTVLRYADADFKITANDATIWNPSNIKTGAGMWFAGIAWEPDLMHSAAGQAASWKMGMDTNTWTLIYTPQFTDAVTGFAFPERINGVPWIEAASSGYLEQADVIVSTAYYAAPLDNPPPAKGLSPVGTIDIFRGIVGDVDVGNGAVYLTVQDYRFIMSTMMMPRNTYQSSCRNTLFDTRCTLSRATFSRDAIVGAGSTRGKIVASANLPLPGGSNTYALGLIQMTSGANAGFSRYITGWDGVATLNLLQPFPLDIAPGDTFTVSAGCDKSIASCTAFGNRPNFRGESFIPVPEVSIG